MIWIEQKYINLLSYRLDNFKQKSASLYNCRCPYCNDSKTHKSKARGYIYEKSGSFNFYCHNCGESKKFHNFLKTLDYTLFSEYKKELLVHAGDKVSKDAHVPEVKKFDAEMNLSAVADLPRFHPVVKYVRSRLIPDSLDSELFYSPRYMEWVNGFIPEKFNEDLLKLDEPRLVIPLLDMNGKLFGSVGRSLQDTSKMRYNTIIFDESKPKVYGLHKVNFNKKFQMVEGPLDSLFLDNALAAAGSDLLQAAMKVNADFSRATFVFDNERRNAEIVRKMKETIEKGFRVMFWPENIEQKDINKMIMDGVLNRSEIMFLIDQLSLSGLSAQLQLSKWKRV